MIDRDRTGLAAATIALGLAVGALAAEAWTTRSPTPDIVAQANLAALETQGAGQPLVVRDQSTGVSATIIPAAVWPAGNDVWCRTYVVERSPSRHVACRDSAGRWTAMSDTAPQLASN